LAEIAATRQALARRVASLAASITELQERPLPSPSDRSLVAQADAAGLPVMWEGLGGLRSRASDLGIQIARLESRHEQVLTRMREEGTAVRREIVANARVVAATLAMLRMRPELRDRDYSCVIVDEVSFAPVPDVIFAVSRATSGVTLLGDFLQNGPIAPEELGDSDDNTVRRWYFRDSFEFFGITDADSAMASKGCTVLTKQYRFGPVITELANTVAYRGILEPGDPDRDPASSPDPAEVVLVDVDGLGDELAGIRPGPKSGKWWPAGALLAQALAGQAVRQALDAGKPASKKAGVVVPYRAQLDIVKDVLNESGANPQIEAGTSHRFQGREFDTVIFDLVEDGKGWVARGDLTGGRWAAGGLRMFNVGITRARQRLRGHATLIDLYDEENLPDELARRIDAADKAIWLWSPWVGQRSEQLMPHLLAARDRGVRVHPGVLPRDEVTRRLKPRHERPRPPPRQPPGGDGPVPESDPRHRAHGGRAYG
jgi:AAA domain